MCETVNSFFLNCSFLQIFLQCSKPNDFFFRWFFFFETEKLSEDFFCFFCILSLWENFLIFFMNAKYFFNLQNQVIDWLKKNSGDFFFFFIFFSFVRLWILFSQQQFFANISLMFETKWFFSGEFVNFYMIESQTIIFFMLEIFFPAEFSL